MELRGRVWVQLDRNGFLELACLAYEHNETGLDFEFVHTSRCCEKFKKDQTGLKLTRLKTEVTDNIIL